MSWTFKGASLERRRTIPVPLNVPDASGNSTYNVAAFTSWQVGHWRYAKDVDGFVYGAATLPWNVTPTALVVGFNIAANATAGVTRMVAYATPVADGEQLNFAAWEVGPIAQDVTVPATAYLQKKVELTMTGATWAAGDTVVVSVGHNGAHANDTLAVETLLLNCWLRVE